MLIAGSATYIELQTLNSKEIDIGFVIKESPMLF